MACIVCENEKVVDGHLCCKCSGESKESSTANYLLLIVIGVIVLSFSLSSGFVSLVRSLVDACFA